jgi:hypothetical protein
MIAIYVDDCGIATSDESILRILWLACRLEGSSSTRKANLKNFLGLASTVDPIALGAFT